MKQFFSRTFWYALGGMASFYGVAAIGYYTELTPVLILTSVIGSAFLAYKRLDLAVLLVFAELFSNPHGALLIMDVYGFPLSFRMSIFLGVMLGWGIGFIRKKYSISFQDNRLHIFALIGFAVIFGLIIGVLSRNFLSVFMDGNAYFYLLYLLPIVSISWNQTYRHQLLQIFSAGAVWNVLISFIIFYIFTHFWVALLTPFYEFLRDLRIAEVTDIGGGFYRVFVQSQMYSILFGLMLIPYIIKQTHKKSLVIIFSAILSILLLSLSRSFWVGIIPAVGVLLAALYYTNRPSVKQVTTFFGGSIATIAMAILILCIVALFPFPQSSLNSNSVMSSLKERTTETQDVAISSRWNLLTPMLNNIMARPLIGHGFGTEITFQTDDPRARAINPDGTWSTSSMEWGWLELWIKMGFLGPLAFLYVAFAFVKKLWTYVSTEQSWIGIGLISGLVFIYATHFFSPYLNHPLGLGFLLFIVPFLSSEKTASSHSQFFFAELFSLKKTSIAPVTQVNQNSSN